MSMAFFKVTGRVNGAAGATITIDRAHGVIHVRPHRQRREYTITLQEVAEIVVAKAVEQGLPTEVAGALLPRKVRRGERKVG